jgi:hypothetical protein
MAELSNLLEKMNKRQEKKDQAQLDALGSLESSFPKAFVERAEVLVGEKKLFEHSEQLDSIRRGVAGISLTFAQRFQDFFTNFAGIMPNRAARKRALGASIATELMQADMSDIAKAMGSGEKRAKIEEREKRRGLFGGLGGMFEDLGKTLGMFKKVGKGGKAVEKNRELLSYQKKMLGFARVTAESTGNLNENFMENMKDKKKKGMGFFAALIVGGIVLIYNFFKEIAIQTLWMGKMLKGGFKLLFKPLKFLLSKAGILRIGAALRDSIGNTIMGIGDTISDYMNKKGLIGKFKVREWKWVKGLDKLVTNGVKMVKSFFEPVGKFFKGLASKAMQFAKFAKTATGFVGFAGRIGTLLGKLFYPIFILTSAWDAITGALDGWEKEGKEKDATIVTQFVAAVGGGIAKFFKNLIGVPMKYIGLAVGWLVKKLGFNEAGEEISEFANKIPEFISNLFGAPFDYLKKGIKWLTNLFTSDDPVAELETLWKNLVGTGNWLVNAIGTALDDVWEWFKSLFDIDFAAVAKAIVPDWAPDFIKEAVGIPVKGKSVAELEGELKAKVDASSSGMYGPTERQMSDIKLLREEIETLKRQNQTAAAGGGVNVNAPTNITKEGDSYSSFPTLNRANPLVTLVAGSPF